MTLLHEKLQQKNAVAISAIAGMGGVGKTELATQYARQYEADYPGGICWLNARDTNLAAEIIQFYQFYVDNQRKIPQELGGRQLTVVEQAIWCWDNWRPDKGLILVIWDDVTDLASCQQLLPTDNRFRLLITTRLRNLDPNIVEEIPLLRSCTWKYGCQNHNYVQEKLTVQYQVKEETLLFLGRLIPRLFVQPHPNQVVTTSEWINKSSEQ